MNVKKPHLGVERGGPPPNFTEEQLCAWIAGRAGRPAAEVRAARQNYREERGITLSGDPELDAVRLAVEAALDARSPRGPIPRRRTKPSSPRTRTTTTTPTPTPTGSGAAARAAAYGTTWRKK